MFYEYFNTISICTRDLQWYCRYNEIHGYENYVGYQGYCCVCPIVDTYCINDFEKVKDNPVKLFKLASEFFEDVKLCYEFHPRIDFWPKDFEFKCRDNALREMESVYLKDCDYF